VDLVKLLGELNRLRIVRSENLVFRRDRAQKRPDLPLESSARSFNTEVDIHSGSLGCLTRGYRGIQNSSAAPSKIMFGTGFNNPHSKSRQLACFQCLPVG